MRECQLDLYADRTSATTMRANQLRLWFASMAYVLLCALPHGSSPWAEGPRIALVHTQFARACRDTIRLKLLKIGAFVRTSPTRQRRRPIPPAAVPRDSIAYPDP